STIAALGGKVKYQYSYIDGIAADVPASAMDALRSAVGSAAIVKDVVMEAPQNMARIARAEGNSATAIPKISAFLAAAPDSYKLNNLGLNVAGLHAGLPPNKQPLTGAGVIVAVIDSGVRPGYPILDSDNSVIGGKDFVGDKLGFSNKKNDPHGTFVAG